MPRRLAFACTDDEVAPIQVDAHLLARQSDGHASTTMTASTRRRSTPGRRRTRYSLQRCYTYPLPVATCHGVSHACSSLPSARPPRGRATVRLVRRQPHRAGRPPRSTGIACRRASTTDSAIYEVGAEARSTSALGPQRRRGEATTWRAVSSSGCPIRKDRPGSSASSTRRSVAPASRARTDRPAIAPWPAHRQLRSCRRLTTSDVPSRLAVPGDHVQSAYPASSAKSATMRSGWCGVSPNGRLRRSMKAVRMP